jgi:hypothetical protein
LLHAHRAEILCPDCLQISRASGVVEEGHACVVNLIAVHHQRLVGREEAASWHKWITNATQVILVVFSDAKVEKGIKLLLLVVRIHA